MVQNVGQVHVPQQGLQLKSGSVLCLPTHAVTVEVLGSMHAYRRCFRGMSGVIRTSFSPKRHEMMLVHAVSIKGAR